MSKKPPCKNHLVKSPFQVIFFSKFQFFVVFFKTVFPFVLIIGTIGYKRLANRDLKQSISESSLQQTTTCSNSTEECEIKIDSILDLEKSCLSYREVETEITQISEVTVPINWDD